MNDAAARLPKKFRLAQPDDLMFERNLTIMASKGCELEVVTYTNDQYVGFMAGLDQQYLQLCLTEDQSLVLVNREYIVRLEETGDTLETLEQDHYNGLVQLRAKVEHFRSIAAKRR